MLLSALFGLTFLGVSACYYYRLPIPLCGKYIYAKEAKGFETVPPPPPPPPGGAQGGVQISTSV